MRNRYNFELLNKHSNETTNTTRKTLNGPIAQVRKSFSFLDYHFHFLEGTQKSLLRNVKLALTARFTNHLFAALLLIERGLTLDAFNCMRSAIETTAFYWLVCKDSAYATLYDREKSPPPVEIRRHLEGLGIDVTAIRELYNLQSMISHVGNRYDHLQIHWENSKSGKLLIGGRLNLELQKAMLEALIVAVFRFVKFEDNYIVPDLDGEK